MWLLVQRRLSQLRGRVRQQQQHRQLRHVVVCGVPRAAGERDGDLRRRLMWLLVQRRLPQLRRRVREQFEHGDMRRFVHGVRAACERNRDLRWHVVRVHVQRRLP